MGTYTKQFQSIDQFYKYLCDTPFNDAFRWSRHSSAESSYKFTQTHTFEQAVHLMRDGWPQMAERLNKQLAVKIKQCATIVKRKQHFGVVGFQPAVPLYLAVVPTNMVSYINVKVKSKVVNITKVFNYSSSVSSDTIIEQSVKTLQIVHQLERQGYRVNLSVAVGSTVGDTTICAKVLIKKASEKINVSKLAFPLVHPSMLRRLFFRYIEVCPETTKGFVRGYGCPVGYDEMKRIFPNEIVLPSICDGDVESIKNLESLAATV